MKTHPNNRRNKLILLGLVTVLGVALEAFLFSAAGPFLRFGNIDLSFLFAPLSILLVLFVFSALIPIVFVNQYTLLFSTGIQYFAVTVFTYLIFHRAILFSRLPFLNDQLTLLSSLSDSALYLAFFWIGLGFYTISNLVIPFKRGPHFHRPLFAMLGYMIMGLSFWKTLNVFSVYWIPLQGLGFVIGLSLIIVALSRLAGYITSPLVWFVDRPLRWALDHPVKLFWLVILVMVYFIFARPMVYSISSYAYLIEWVVVCFVGYEILNSVKNNLKARTTQPQIEVDWKKHQQIVHFISDDEFNKMVSLQDEFIQTGGRRNLLIFLSELLKTNGIRDEQIGFLLEPLLEYKDVKQHWYNRWLLKNKTQITNQELRLKVLAESIRRIRGIMYPTSAYVNGATNA